MDKLRINFIDNWEKKDVNLEELRQALEDGNSSLYKMCIRDRAMIVEPDPLKEKAKAPASRAAALKSAKLLIRPFLYGSWSLSAIVLPIKSLFPVIKPASIKLR